MRTATKWGKRKIESNEQNGKASNGALVCSQNSSSVWTEQGRPRSRVQVYIWSSPGYCTHLLLGGASRMPPTVNDLRESWGEAFDRVSARKTHQHSPPSVKSLTMICSRRFAPIIHMFCTVSCRRNLYVYTLDLRERYHNFVLPDNSFTLLNCNSIN